MASARFWNISRSARPAISTSRAFRGVPSGSANTKACGLAATDGPERIRYSRWMRIVTNTADLKALVAELEGAPYLALDTEFLRDQTYWPKLCLIQVASPQVAAIIDPLADGIDLTPFYDLLKKPNIVKVFHAARQDIEIFHQQGGVIPNPLFDTQVAAMVAGYGDAASYETLARKIANVETDKSSRFTDWSRRPLSNKQLEYAIGDVTHLRKIYEVLDAELKKTHREA